MKILCTCDKKPIAIIPEGWARWQIGKALRANGFDSVKDDGFIFKCFCGDTIYQTFQLYEVPILEEPKCPN